MLVFNSGTICVYSFNLSFHFIYFFIADLIFVPSFYIKEERNDLSTTASLVHIVQI